MWIYHFYKWCQLPQSSSSGGAIRVFKSAVSLQRTPESKTLFLWVLKALLPFLMLVEMLVDLDILGYSLYMYWYLLGDLIIEDFPCIQFHFMLTVECNFNIRCDFFKMATICLLFSENSWDFIWNNLFNAHSNFMREGEFFYTVEEIDIQLFAQRSHINNWMQDVQLQKPCI